MNQVSTLTLAPLLAHARAAAVADEARHAAITTGMTSSQRNEQTLRGWGGAALLDLEWNSRCVYGKAEKDAYRAAYAVEYLRLRALRIREHGEPAASAEALRR